MMEAWQIKSFLLVLAEITQVNVKIEAMKAANRERQAQGIADAYGESHFLDLIEEHGIHHNAICSMLEGM